MPTHSPHKSPFILYPFLFILLLVLLLTTAACSATPTLPDIHFDSVTATIKSKPFTLEVADTDAKRERGLMYRTTMPADHGMVFIFDIADNYGFWMKNTELPLDIIFLDEKCKVVGTATMKPHDETPTHPDGPYLFAIELNAGVVKALGLAKDETITLPEKLLKRPAHSDEK